MKIKVEIIQETRYLFEVEAPDGKTAVEKAFDIFIADEFDPDTDCVSFINEPEHPYDCDYNLYP